MSDYIDREEAKKCLKMGMAYEIYKLPSADVRENVKGEWTEWQGEKFAGLPICSNCSMGFSIIAKGWSFCPNCGADMRGDT